MAFGFLDTQYIDFPEGQTEARLRSMQTRAGLNVRNLVTRLDAALTALNQPDPLISMLSYTTTKDRINAPLTGRKVWQRGAEYTPARPQRGVDGGGHLLPLYWGEMDMAFTERKLHKMLQDEFDDEVRSTVQAIRTGERADALERLFIPDEIPLDDDGNGASPGFAGSGTGTNVFRGELPGGLRTPNGYTHYGYTTEAGLEAALDQFIAQMSQWHRAPFDLISTPDVVAMIAKIDPGIKFVPAGSALVRPGSDQAEALVDPTVYTGVYDGVLRIRHGDWQITEGSGSTNAMAIVKTYGPNNAQNPLAYRYDDDYGNAFYVEDRALFPLTQAAILKPYAFGVSARVGAALISVGAGQATYTPPTIYR